MANPKSQTLNPKQRIPQSGIQTLNCKPDGPFLFEHWELGFLSLFRIWCIDIGIGLFREFRNFKYLGLVVVWMGISALPAHAAQKAAASDSGVFFILSGQKRIGTEKFKITSAASGVETAGEIEVEMPGSPKVSETSLLKLDQDLRPSSYERQQKLPKKGSITAQFGSPESKLVSKTEAGTDERLFYLPGDQLAVLDTNFFHHYSILLREYDAEHGGPQHFNVFVPQEATPGTISLEFQGKESQQVGKATRELNHYQALTDQVKIDIWATPQGEIYRISIPQANLEVRRQ